MTRGVLHCSPHPPSPGNTGNHRDGFDRVVTQGAEDARREDKWSLGLVCRMGR